MFILIYSWKCIACQNYPLLWAMAQRNAMKWINMNKCQAKKSLRPFRAYIQCVDIYTGLRPVLFAVALSGHEIIHLF